VVSIWEMNSNLQGGEEAEREERSLVSRDCDAEQSGHSTRWNESIVTACPLPSSSTYARHCRAGRTTFSGHEGGNSETNCSVWESLAGTGAIVISADPRMIGRSAFKLAFFVTRSSSRFVFAVGGGQLFVGGRLEERRARMGEKRDRR
jgi:hypothetical protein